MNSTGTIHALVVMVMMTLASPVGAADLAQSLQRESPLDRQAAAQDAQARIQAIKATAVAILTATDPVDAPYYIEEAQPLALCFDILHGLQTSDISDLLVKHARTYVTGISPGRKAANMLIANGSVSIPACLNGIRIASDEGRIALLCHVVAKILHSEEAARERLMKEAGASSDKAVSMKFELTAARISDYVALIAQESRLELIKIPDNPWDERTK